MNQSSMARSSWRRLSARTALLTVAVAGICASAASSASAALFPQCPPVGNNQGCSQLILVNHDFSVTVKVDPAAPASGYDGVEDTLVGVQNNSPGDVSSLNLASPGADIFAFDGDGLCNPGNWPSAPAVTPSNCPGPQGFGSTGYEGPNNTFSNISANFRTGTVNFTSPIKPGGSAYWGLEEALQPGQLLSGAGGAPITTPPRVSGLSITFSIICVGTSGCSGMAQIVVIEHRQGKAWIARRRKPATRKVVVGSVRVSIPGGESSSVTVSLNRTGRKLLSGRSSLRAQVQLKLGGRVTPVGKVMFKGHKSA
ncbi:MAG TPA: hypothetical protein VF781_06890 [Solirubrobacteraceae bacterium]